jgi:hypothetical protein
VTEWFSELKVPAASKPLEISNRITSAPILVDSSALEQDVSKLDDKIRAKTVIADANLFLTTITP